MTAQRCIETPLGAMWLRAQDGALTGAWFADQPDCPYREDPKADPKANPMQVHGATLETVLDRAESELLAYFGGRCRSFTVALSPPGTPFQRRVWDALLDLPFGVLESYGALARRCARIGAVRAVAQAVGSNPISIFIPCHRIVGSDGTLTGFGGGLPRKHALLAAEGHVYSAATPRARRIATDACQGTLNW